MKYLIEAEKNNKGTKPNNNSQKKNEQINCFYNLMNPSNKIQCDVCKRDITKYTKILANDCDYCVGCFSNLEKCPQIYHVVNKLDYPLFDSQWSAEEDLLLFQGIQKHGFGNWGEIADFIGTNKTREDVQDHYTSIFIEAPDFYPQKQEVLTLRDKSNRLIIKNTKQPARRPRQQKHFTKSSVSNNHQFQRGSLTVNNVNTSLKTGTNPAEIVGYMPRRGDFEVQYDNDAQLLLAQMEFNDDDSQEEKKMKFRLIDIYNHKLTERIKRKQFVIGRKLLDLKEQSRLDKARTKEEKQIYNMMKVFARFNCSEQHEKLVMGIIKEKQIRQRIQELKEFKKKGFRTLAEVQEELENKRRNNEKKKKSQTDYYSTYDNKNTTRRSRKDPIDKTQKRSGYISKQEEELINKFNISIKHYFMIKETIIRQSVKQGILERDSTSKIFRIDRNVFEGIFDFLVQKEDIIGK